MIVIIAGSRSITSKALVGEAIRESGWWDDITEVVSGGAIGVDSIGEEWSRRFLGKEATRMLPEYTEDPKSRFSAPLERNAAMAQYVKEHGGGGLIAVWRPDSREIKKGGTVNMILEAYIHGLQVCVKVIHE